MDRLTDSPPVFDILHNSNNSVWSECGICRRDTSRIEDQPVMNNKWMLNAFCNYCEDKLNTSFVVRCTSNHVPAAQFVKSLSMTSAHGSGLCGTSQS